MRNQKQLESGLSNGTQKINLTDNASSVLGVVGHGGRTTQQEQSFSKVKPPMVPQQDQQITVKGINLSNVNQSQQNQEVEHASPTQNATMAK